MQPNQPRLSLNLSFSQYLTPTDDGSFSPLTAVKTKAPAGFTDASLTPTTPRLPKTPMHVRRKTYAGDLAEATRTAVRDYQERIALLESQNSRMSVELEATRDALVDEREERRIERHSLIIPSPVPSSQTALDSHINEQSEALYERKLRMEILETLKKIRAQNSTLARSLREQQDKCVSITSVLEAERVEKKGMEEEMQRLSQKNFMLLEHNKVLVGRDSALQQDISTLIMKCQADEWMRGVLEAELRKTRQDTSTLEGFQFPSAEIGPTITLEDQGPLRVQLVAARDELHITRLRLEASEKKCGELDERVRSLQQQMTQCLDSSSQALEVERELRAEVAEHADLLEHENQGLKSDMDAMKLELEQLRRRKKVAGQADALVAENETLRGKMKALEMEMEELRRSKIPTGLKAAHMPSHHQPLCGAVQKVTVDVRNVSFPLTPVSASSETNDDIAKQKILRRDRLLDRQLRSSASKKASRRRSSLKAAYLGSNVSISRPAEIFTVKPSAPLLNLSDPPDSCASTMVECPSRSPSPSKSLLERPSVENSSTRPSRPPSGLKLLRLGSPSGPLSPQKESKSWKGDRNPSRPSSIQLISPAVPSAPPSTPLRPNVRSDSHSEAKETAADGLFRFRAFSSHSPDSPDSAVSTLVATSPATKAYTANKRTSLMLPNALLSRLPSFGSTLKAASTLFLDVDHRDDEQVSSIVKSARSIRRRSRTGMRRASAVLVHIAQTSGIDDIAEWFIV